MYSLYLAALRRLDLEGAVPWDRTNSAMLPAGQWHRVSVKAIKGGWATVVDGSERTTQVPLQELGGAGVLGARGELLWRYSPRLAALPNGNWVLLSDEGGVLEEADRSYKLIDKLELTFQTKGF